MKTKPTISFDNLPTKLPLGATVLYFLALDYWNAPEWLWGVVGLIMLVSWISNIISIAREKRIDIFEPEDKKETLKDKLKKMMDEHK